MNPINLYSAPLLFLFVLLLAGGFLMRRGASLERLLALAVLALGLVAIWYLLRPVQTSPVELAELRSRIGAGRPVLLEFQSPY